MVILNLRERFLVIFLAACIGIFLSIGFIPTSDLLADFFLKNNPLVRMFSFVSLSLLFFITCQSKDNKTGANYYLLSLTSLLPLLLSFLFGFYRGLPSCLTNTNASFWFLICIPLGEEFLFRGWLYNLFDRIFPLKFFTATNPLPSSIWGSSIGFSLWHIQNYGTLGFWGVLLQLTYCLVDGFWLGYLRWKTGGLIMPILMHFLLNLMFNLKI